MIINKNWNTNNTVGLGFALHIDYELSFLNKRCSVFELFALLVLVS